MTEKIDNFKLHQAVNLLERDHCGKNNCIKRRDMAQFLFGNDSPSSIRETRALISEASHRYPIAFSTSSDGGYFYIDTPEELEEFMGKCESYAKKFLIKRAMLNKVYQRKTGVQKTLPFVIKELIPNQP